MREARVLIGVVSLILVVLSVRISAAQIDSRMPEGPNRTLVARLCTTCHDIGHLVSTGGLRVTPEERALILDYLATYLPR